MPRSRFTRRRVAAVAGLLLVPIFFAGCLPLFGPRTVEVPQARLQELIERRFPLKKRVLDAIELTVDAPHLTLRPESNRIGVELALNATSDGVVGSVLGGTLLVSQGLRFEASDNTVRLTDVRVERFAIDGIPGPWQRQVDRLGKPLARALLEGQVLYALRPKDIAGLEGRGVRPAELRVTSSGLAITLLPIER